LRYVSCGVFVGPPWPGITEDFGVGQNTNSPRHVRNRVGFDDLRFYLRNHLRLEAGSARTELLAADYGTLQFEAATKKIIRTLGTWDDVVPPEDDYSAAGTRVIILGSDDNDGTYTVVGLGATNQELVVVEDLVDEAASAAEVVKGHLVSDSLVTPEPAGYPGPEPTSEVP